MTKVNDVARPLITKDDLDVTLIDRLNALQAQIDRMAELTHVDAGTLKLAAMESSTRVLKAKAAQERSRLNREQLTEDRAQFTAWANSAQFIYENAEEWKKEAELEWKAITGRNGSEHGQTYLGSYREPTKKELLAAMAEWERWENADEDKYAHARSVARRALPVIRKKLAAILMK